MSSYTRLEVRREGPVGWLIFDRPEVGNAMDAVMFDELERAWLDLDADPVVRVIVNTGNGAAFQTGLDVVALARDKAALRVHARRTRDAELRFTAWHLDVWKPVIAAINGVCAGGGLHFVADADIRIAADDATFVDPHVSIGQVTAFEGIALSRQSPMESIMRMALIGRHERLTAGRAHQLGIISEVVPPDSLRTRAQELAETIAQNSPTAMALSKQALWGAFEHGLTEACKRGGQKLVAMWGHPDQAEGPLAFAERRPAEWRELDRDLVAGGQRNEILG
jgi:enoyl-CoA hydratase/carnithine racemase